MKILIIEDEVKTAQTLKQGLEENHFEVELAFDGIAGLMLAARSSFDLIITDVIMPGLNGFDVCKSLRNQGINTPVIILSALGMTTDKLTGFDAGTDDYLVKPFEFEELLARVNSLLKRAMNVLNSGNKLSVADLLIDLDTKEVIRAGRQINLTAKEFALLEYFIRNKGKVISRVDIAEKVWDINFDTGTNVIDVYVNYLRKKIDKDFGRKLIHTRVGMGYILKAE